MTKTLADIDKNSNKWARQVKAYWFNYFSEYLEHLKNGKYRNDNSLNMWGILVKIKKVYNFIFAISACVFRFLPRWDGANTPSRQSDRREINFSFLHYATTCFSRMEGINPDRLRSTVTKRGLRGVGRFDTYQIILLSINSACGPPARILRFFVPAVDPPEKDEQWARL